MTYKQAVKAEKKFEATEKYLIRQANRLLDGPAAYTHIRERNPGLERRRIKMHKVHRIHH